MRFVWTEPAIEDLNRVYEFLISVNQPAAERVVQTLVSASVNLVTNPQSGAYLSEFEPRKVRRLILGNYELRYELKDEIVHILRVWHTRENRE
ncbi:type II toxin-antitoxin system RelE/ParE family toxin [Dryocola clanedunensis]|uniref:type II toxin-antitoxin system RelE/ParE family toxin n=1 Tax=Cedecea sulfonylureivorans TaxID=3051154 RepID=UPI00192819D3|nr:type II toxin-antitoxin system RelE/ParE family toxin [Cedecea sulfonylureivorans]